MICSREKIRRLGSSRFINVSMNNLLSRYRSSMDLSILAPDSRYLSGVIRFYMSNDKLKVPFYRMLILVDNKVYCYRRIHSNRVVDLNKYDTIIEFDSMEESKLYWEEYIRNEIIRL